MELDTKKIRAAIIEPVGGYGGMQFYDLGLANGLSQYADSVCLFSSKIVIDHAKPNVYIYNLFDRVWDTSNKLLRFLFHIYYYMNCMLISSRRGCKIVHLHQFHFTPLFALNILVARIFYKKVVLTIHDIESFSKKKVSSSIERFAYALISAFIVHNKFSYDVLKEKITSNRITIIKHGNYVPFVKQVGNKEIKQPFKILFFGQIKKVKGLDILLHALSIVKKQTINFELCIAGRVWRDNIEFYKSIIELHHLATNVKMDLRFIPDDELVTLFEEASIVVLPYKEIYQSGVLLKSMSFGRAVLCSDLPPFKEIISDGINGFLFESENPESLANKIIHIYHNQEKLQRIEKVAFDDVVCSHDWNKIGHFTNELYIKQLV